MTDTREPDIAAIQEAVCDHFGISTRGLLSPNRPNSLAHPRQVAMWLCSRLTTKNPKAIGQRFKRDRTTVIYAVEAIDSRIHRADRYGISALILLRRFTQDDPNQLSLGGL
jgi:chromosomal replication initiator protein